MATLTLPPHTLSHSNKLFWGNAYQGLETRHAGARGVPMDPTVRVNLGAPAAGAANAISTSASVTAGASSVFTASTGVTVASSVATLATPRNVVGAWTGTAVVTVTGKDQYGATMSEASASGTSFTGKKAFVTITSIVPSANITVSTFGTGNVLGLPYCCAGAFDVITAFEDTTVRAATSSNFVAADATSPATTTTGDVRGTYAPTTTPNGTVVFRVRYQIQDTDTNINAFGVTQA